MKSLLLFGLLTAGIVISSCAAPGADLAGGKLPAGKVYELRIYKANPGKLDALHARFRDHTCRLFKKHGIEMVGFWTPVESEASQNTLIYLVAFPSAEAQKQAWQAFRDDPEWKKAKAESEQDGVLVNEVQSTNLAPTDYSPLR